MTQAKTTDELQEEALQQSVAVSRLTMDVLQQTTKQLRIWRAGFVALAILDCFALLLYLCHQMGVIS